MIDVEKRYPSEIEKVVYSQDNIVSNCILFEALERLEFNFSDITQEKKYKEYRCVIEKAVYNYGDSIQNMNLEETKVSEALQQILKPSYSVLSDRSNVEQAHYKYSKIAMYLSGSDGRSYESASGKLKSYTYAGCCGMGVCTNAEWGIIQLLLIKDELIPYFPIECNATDKEIYFQYCTALYYANEEANT